jgi:hypothetical protein
MPASANFLGQAVLQRAEGALGAAPRLGRVGRDVLDAELRERPPDLGRLILGDRRARLGRVEIVARPVGVERAWQAVRHDHLGERSEAAAGAFFLDQEGRVELAGHVVLRDDQIERCVERRQPAVRRAVLMQQHAAQRPARALLAVRAAARRLGEQPGRLQAQLDPGVAQAEAVVLAQLVVEVLGREAGVALAIQAQHRLDLVDRHASARGLAERAGLPGEAGRPPPGH